jgi:CRP-like cAMP-binding protein
MAHEPKAGVATEIPDPAETVSLDPGEFLFREGEAAHELYIVRKGVLRIVSGSTVYETVRAGGIVGEMGIVEQGARRSASVIAGTRAELVKIDTAKFLALVANTPDSSLEVMRVMARRLRVMNRRYTGTITTEWLLKHSALRQRQEWLRNRPGGGQRFQCCGERRIPRGRGRGW